MDILPNDCLLEITKLIDTGSSWKTWVILSKRHYSSSRRFPDRIICFANKLRTLLKLFPDKDWHKLESNPSITWDVTKSWNSDTIRSLCSCCK